MISTASASLSWRTSISGQPCPRICFVQVLSCADSQEEAPRQHVFRGCGRLRDDSRVKAKAWTCHSSADDEFACDLRDATDNAPDKRTLPLPVCPRVIVVRNGCEREAVLLGRTRL